MKIAEIIYSLDCGGAEAFAVTLSMELAARDNEVALLLLNRPNGKAIELRRLELLRQAGVTVRFLDRRPGSALSLLAAVWRLAGELRRGRYEVIHSHLVWCDIAARTAALLCGRRGRVVTTIHSTVLASMRSGSGRLWRLALRGMQPVFCAEAAWRQNKLEIPNAICIPNGIAAGVGTDDEVDSFLSEHGISTQDRRLLLAVGSLYEVKAQDRLILAVKELRAKYPDLLLLICGNGRSRVAYRELIDRNDLQEMVRMPGICMCIPGLLRRAALLVSASNYEGMPIAVLEALYAGTPVVLSPIPSHLELHREIGGIEIAPGMSAADMATAIDRALSHRLELRAALDGSKAGLSRYSIEHCAQKYLEIFRECSE